MEPWIFVVFALTTLAFVTCTAIATRHFATVERDTDEIRGNAIPTLVELAGVRAAVRQLETEVDQAIAEQSPAQLEPLAATIEAIRATTAAYAADPAYPGEQEHWREADGEIQHMIRAAEATRQLLAAGKTSAARALVTGEFRPSAARADAALWTVVELNVRQGERHAQQIESIRTQSIALSFALDGIVVVVSGALAAIAFTVLHRSNAALEVRSRDLEQFAERVAHDIRGPLSPALMVLQKVRRSAPPSEALEKACDRAESGVRHVTSMVDDLLAFARAGGVPRQGARAPVAYAVQGTFDESSEFAQQRAVDLVTDVPGDLVAACAPGVLDSILSNLVRNAIKYMDDAHERRVTVRAFPRRRFVRIEVADTGPGLPPDAAARVFEPYVRASAKGSGGFGLGLATVRRLVEAHGGRLGVESGPGGATFWVELPSA